ncbi:hypothetical protein CC86DRAFT_437682 [Ophiobolus disseminans]|uniref:Uncharacterized protein n=1 Tax=Ophiobolus disseminans TaxID=1469910 RepID=A0A6A7A586_9PLEO|nr:hypothetical protein CC86DRAFT_437682 [Ophiobolus disseminans]
MSNPRVDGEISTELVTEATGRSKRKSSAIPTKKSSRKKRKTNKALSAEPVVESEDATIVVNVPQAVDTVNATQDATNVALALEQARNQTNRFHLADLLIKFIFQIDTDAAVLDLLAGEWTQNMGYYRNTTKELYSTFDAVFFEWLKIQKAIIEFKSHTLPTSSMALKDKARRMLAHNQLRAQHAHWTALTYEVRGKPLESVQALSLMLCNVVAMLGHENLATYEEGLRAMGEEVKKLHGGEDVGAAADNWILELDEMLILGSFRKRGISNKKVKDYPTREHMTHDAPATKMQLVRKVQIRIPPLARRYFYTLATHTQLYSRLLRASTFVRMTKLLPGAMDVSTPTPAPAPVAGSAVTVADSMDSQGRASLPPTQVGIEGIGNEQQATAQTHPVPTGLAGPTAYDRAFWARRMANSTSGGLTIRQINNALGLKREGGTAMQRGPPTYVGDNVTQLAQEVATLSAQLPLDKDQLLDVAVSPDSIGAKVDDLLKKFKTIWSVDQDKSWLIQASEGVQEYPKDLKYNEIHDRAILKEYLRQWVILKALNTYKYQRNKPPRSIEKVTDVQKLPNGKLPHVPSAYSRAYWAHKIEVPHGGSLSIRSVADSLGLEFEEGRATGDVSFQDPKARQLKIAINAIIRTLPNDKDSLLDIAATPEKLYDNIDQLLLKFGDALWGGNIQDVKGDPQRLVYGRLADRIQIRNYLRLWILVRALRSYDYTWKLESRVENQTVETQDTPQVTTGTEYDLENYAPVGSDAALTPSIHVNEITNTLHTTSFANIWRLDSRGGNQTVETQDTPVTAGNEYDYEGFAPDSFDATLTPSIQINEITKTLDTTSFPKHVSATPQLEPRVTATLDGNLRGYGGAFVPKTAANLAAATSSQSDNIAMVIDGSSGRAVRSTRKPMATYNETILNGGGRHTPTKYLENHHKNVLRGSLNDRGPEIRPGSSRSSTPLIPNDTQTPASNPLDLSQPWKEATWRRFIDRSPLRMSIFPSSLGFQTHHTQKGLEIDHPSGIELHGDVDHLASRLYAELQADQLLTAAVNRKFLDEIIRNMEVKYAPGIWDQGADRRKLLQAGANETYPQDLVSQKEEDCEIIRLHLHQWVFAKAFSNLRKNGDSQVARAAILTALKQPNPDGNAGKVQDMPFDLSLLKKPEVAATEETTKPEASATSTDDTPSPIRSSTQEDSDKPTSSGKRKYCTSPDSLSPEHTPKKLKPTLPPAKMLTTIFLQYLDTPCLEQEFFTEEEDTLDAISHQLTLTTPHLPTLLGSESVSTEFASLLNAWLTYRRAILSVRKREHVPEAEGMNDVYRKIFHSRLLTELRVARDAFIDVDAESELMPDSVICMAFESLQETVQEGEEVRGKVNDGFGGLDDELGELGDRLGCGWWLFGPLH